MLAGLATRLSAMQYPRPAAASLVRKVLKHARREGDDDGIWVLVTSAVSGEWVRNLMKSAWIELSPVEAHDVLALMHGIVKTARHPDTPPDARNHLMLIVDDVNAEKGLCSQIARQLPLWRPYVRRRAIDLLAALVPISITAMRALAHFLSDDPAAPAAWTRPKDASSISTDDDTTEFCELEGRPDEEREATRTAILALLHAAARSSLSQSSDITAIRALILSPPQFTTALSLFSDNDVQLCTALADLVHIHRRAPLPAQLSPHALFAKNFGSDHGLLVDLVLADASAIDYLLAYLRFAQEERNDATTGSQDPAG
ncbi:hypothetical protein HDU87_001817 [Geranomyces variabilis]|uniref:Uncharacterized protein n=1 Tax=Geranomyces variabilis TaxID=109894 RepID=A0AAD5TPF8_9FUNG|nr:hypothetical protein HDU87_001817 [Geranomyces variabilis]